MKKAMLFLFAFVVAKGTNVQGQSLKKLYPADAEVVITPFPFPVVPVVNSMSAVPSGTSIFSANEEISLKRDSGILPSKGTETPPDK